jgi:hypothetical protein
MRQVADAAHLVAVKAVYPAAAIPGVGSLDPLVPGQVGCIVIRPDGSRYLARVVADPLAERPD